MKGYLLEFVKRGLLAASGGPIVLAAVYGILASQGIIHALTPGEVCLGILTAVLMAFIAGGITMVYQIEELPLLHAAFLHGAVLYADYILIYLLNGWLQHRLTAVLVFTGIFLAGYALIWLMVYGILRRNTQKINQNLRNHRK